MITQDLGYREVVLGSPAVDAVFGAVAQKIVLTDPVTPGDVVEMIAFSR
jgi:hypothetical protein